MARKLLGMLRTALEVADNVNNTYIIPKDTQEGLSKYAIDTDDMTNSQRGMSLARAALNGDWFDVIKLSFDQIISVVSKDPLTYENFLIAISDYADGKAELISQEENIRFVGGDCELSVIEEEKNVKTIVTLYFKKSDNGWVKKIIEGNTSFNCFTKETLDGEITNIQREGSRKFPIKPSDK